MSLGRRAVFVDGVVQSVDPADAVGGYWEAMLPDGRPRNALLLGVGGGTVGLLLQQRNPETCIVGVDESAEMLRVATETFGLGGPSVELVQGDAFAYIHTSEGRFDFIAVDLYHANRLVCGVLALPFLKALAARLAPGGTVAYNLFRDTQLEMRLARLERVFEPVRVVDIAANAVFHGRPKRPGRRQR